MDAARGSPAPPRTTEMILDQVVRSACLDPESPPALVHGVLALGADVRLDDGVPAIERLVRDNVQVEPDGSFAIRSTREGTKAEGHPGALVKTLLEVGVDPSRRFVLHDDREVSLGALAEVVARAYTPNEAGVPLLEEEWRLEVLAACAEWEPSFRPRVDVLRERALAAVEAQQAFFQVYLDEPERPFKRPLIWCEEHQAWEAAEIYQHFCSGFHLVQAIQRLHGAERPERLIRQQQLFRARIDRELAMLAGAQASVHELPEGPRRDRLLRRVLLEQIDVAGHALETHLRASPPDPWAHALRERILAIAAEMHDLRAFTPDAVERGPLPKFSCASAHALHALRMLRSAEGEDGPA